MKNLQWTFCWQFIIYPGLNFWIRVLQTGKTVADQMNLLNEQVRLLSGEIALCTSSLKRLPVNNPGDTGVEVPYLTFLLLTPPPKKKRKEKGAKDACILLARQVSGWFYKLQEQMQKLRNEINEKKRQICKLEQNTIGLLEAATPASASELSQVLTAVAWIQW